MSRRPFDRREQRIFFRTIGLASFVGCVGFAILAVARGYPLTIPVLCLLAVLMANGVIFGWFGRTDDDDREEL